VPVSGSVHVAPSRSIVTSNNWLSCAAVRLSTKALSNSLKPSFPFAEIVFPCLRAYIPSQLELEKSIVQIGVNPRAYLILALRPRHPSNGIVDLVPNSRRHSPLRPVIPSKINDLPVAGSWLTPYAFQVTWWLASLHRLCQPCVVVVHEYILERVSAIRCNDRLGGSLLQIHFAITHCSSTGDRNAQPENLCFRER